MNLSSESFSDGEPIPERCAFCAPDAEQHAGLGANRNPALSWDELPEGTKSLVLIRHDPDAPATPTDVDTEGKILKLFRLRWPLSPINTAN